MESGSSWGTWICPYEDCSRCGQACTVTTGNEVPPCAECGSRLIRRPTDQDPPFVPWTRESTERNRLERITLRGFKTIRALIDFEPRSRTVLIGPNGAGKSNFISFFRMMSWALSGPGKLAHHVGLQGGSRRILHDGPAHTREIAAELAIRTAAGENEYAFRLFHAAGDTLVFADERYRFSRTGRENKTNWNMLGAGHKDPGLLAARSTTRLRRSSARCCRGLSSISSTTLPKPRASAASGRPATTAGSRRMRPTSPRCSTD